MKLQFKEESYQWTVKRYTTSLVVREIQIITNKFDLSDWQNYTKLIIPSTTDGVEKQEFRSLLGCDELLQSLEKNV